MSKYRDAALEIEQVLKCFDGLGEKEELRALEGVKWAMDQARIAAGVAMAVEVSEKKLAKLVETGEASGVISRTKDNFFWPAGNGIMFIDYDPPKNEQAMTRDELLAVLYGVCPALESAPHVWYPSASSCISRTDTGEMVAGIRGQRVYIGVSDASDIERAGGVLFARLWLAGHGHIQISKSGSKLVRGLVDDSVWQTNRLDFVAGSDCTGPLKQDRGEPMLLGGSEALNTRLTLPNLTTSETDKFIRVKAKAKADVEPEAELARGAYIKTQGAELFQHRGIAILEGEKIAKEAVTSARLLGGFILISQDGDEVAVADVLSNPDRWHGCRFYDPLEGRNYPDGRIAYLNLRSGGRPYIYSHAHGGCRYQLHREMETVEIMAGGMGEAARRTSEMLKADGGFFARGGGVVVPDQRGAVYTPGLHGLKQLVEERVSLKKYDGRTEKLKACDCPDDLVKRIQDTRSMRVLPELTAIATAPLMTQTGRILDQPGYDEQTGLLLINSGEVEWPRIPLEPGRVEVLEALALLWAPFRLFPYSNVVSRGVMLAALLTAVTRRGFTKTPGFVFSAPTAGSGKSRLGECVVELAGAAVAPTTFPRDEAEMKKTLVALARAGAPAVFFDNMSGLIGSDALNSLITSGEINNRLLSSNDMSGNLALPAILVFTGNNVAPHGDMSRRLLTCYIDPEEEKPYTRKFPFDPLHETRTGKREMTTAALTILAGWMNTKPGAGSIGSFEDWDRIIRGAVLWAGEMEREAKGEDAVDFGDPLQSIIDSAESDEEAETLNEILQTWFSVLGTDSVTSAELIGAMNKARQSDLNGGSLVEVGRVLSEAMPLARTAKSLGRHLKGWSNRVVGGLRLRSVRDGGNSLRWLVLEKN